MPSTPSKVTALPVKRGFGETLRPDAWWIQPVVVGLGFLAFIVYSTWAAFQGAFYSSGNLLSPFYSPELWYPLGEVSEHALFGAQPGWWPGFLPYSPAFLILWAPVSFRLTCYYYRGAYYKSYWPGPPSCSVGTPGTGYMGERHFPLIIQNIHRYTLPFALLLLVFLASDAWKALWFAAPGGEEFGLSVGTLVLTANVCLLGSYTFGCHSLRHIVGGGIDRLAGRPVRRTAYECVSWCNKRHMRFAWFSLFWVGFSDAYVRLCAMGIWTDLRIF
ncbi:MAG: succinate dehydrogenase [Gemmatimonadetes bacterium]|nr:succinate dehydrogenase [Gemmatimonadota bacterium]